MPLFDRTRASGHGVEAFGNQCFSAIRLPGGNTLIGQGFQNTDAGRAGIAPIHLNPPNPNLTLGSLLPVAAATGLSTGGNLVNLPFSLLPNASTATPAGGIAFGIVGTRFNINLALQALANAALGALFGGGILWAVAAGYEWVAKREGMGFGDNTRATIITRGLAEMTRLGMAMGGQATTFSGLAGIGDLIATCSSKQSRNNTVGLQLGQGQRIDDVLASMSMVAEGVKSSPSVLDLARRHGVEMPITEQVVGVCHHGRTAPEALGALMQRSRKSELD